MKFEISQELVQAIANYLQTKPFQEVHQLIAALSQLKKIEVEFRQGENNEPK